MTGKTPLHIAVAEQQIETVTNLIDQGTNVNAQDDQNDISPLHIAVKFRNEEIIKLLLNASADVNVKDKNWNTPLHIAVESQSTNIVKLLLDAGADVDAENLNGTPLHTSVNCGNSNMISLLLNAGANVHALGSFGIGILHAAVKSENENILKMLLDAGADINARDEYGCTPLHFAALKSVDIFLFLLRAGADINVKDKHVDARRHSFFTTCARVGSTYIYKLLKDAKDAVDRDTNHGGNTPFFWFLINLYVKRSSEDEKTLNEAFKVAIECFDVNLTDADGKNIIAKILEYSHIPFKDTFFCKIILQHIALLVILDSQVDMSLIRDTIFPSLDYTLYYSKCTSELQKAERTKLNRCRVTLLHVLLDDESKFLKDQWECSKLIKYMESKKGEFPVYGTTMENNILRGVCARLWSFDTAVDVLSDCLPSFDSFYSSESEEDALRFTIIKDILESLCQEDWKNLSKRSLEYYTID